MFAFNYVLMKYVGAEGVAAFTILGFVVYGYSMICIGFGQGISPLVSICRGAHEMEVAAENMVILRLILLRHLKNIWHSLRLLFERQANNWQRKAHFLTESHWMN